MPAQYKKMGKIHFTYKNKQRFWLPAENLS